MKSKELIAELQKLDPTGEIEVVGSSGDIYFAEVQPAYWDGRLAILIRDKEERKRGWYHVKGMKFISSGKKIVLNEMNMKDVIWDQDMNAMIFEFDSEGTEKAIRPKLEEEQARYKKFMEKLNGSCHEK